MKFLFDLQDKYIKPLCEKGGKFENLYPLFEAGDTFILDENALAISRAKDQAEKKYPSFSI